jgi:hypothetical protein
VADGLRVFLPGLRRSRLGGFSGPVLQNFLRQRARLITDAELGLIGGAISLTVALDDIENLLETLAQVRTTGETLVETAVAPFPNGCAHRVGLG